MPQVPKAQIIAEPSQRNTAPCIGLAAKILTDADPNAVMGVFPADHLITKEARFRKFVKAAYKAAENSEVVVLGNHSRWAETGYGYIEFPKGITPVCIAPSFVSSFREKPDDKTANKFVKAGNFFWNAGMFFWKTSTVLELMRRHQPKTATKKGVCHHSKAANSRANWPRFIRSAKTSRLTTPLLRKRRPCPALRSTISAGTMLAAGKLSMSWPKDKDGNASTGEVFVEGSRANYVSAAKPVALVGVENLVIVDTPDAQAVANRSRSQDVSKIVKTLDGQKREELL